MSTWWLVRSSTTCGAWRGRGAGAVGLRFVGWGARRGGRVRWRCARPSRVACGVPMQRMRCSASNCVCSAAHSGSASFEGRDQASLSSLANPKTGVVWAVSSAPGWRLSDVCEGSLRFIPGQLVASHWFIREWPSGGHAERDRAECRPRRPDHPPQATGGSPPPHTYPRRGDTSRSRSLPNVNAGDSGISEPTISPPSVIKTSIPPSRVATSAVQFPPVVMNSELC